MRLEPLSGATRRGCRTGARSIPQSISRLPAAPAPRRAASGRAHQQRRLGSTIARAAVESRRSDRARRQRGLRATCREASNALLRHRLVESRAQTHALVRPPDEAALHASETRLSRARGRSAPGAGSCPRATSGSRRSSSTSAHLLVRRDALGDERHQLLGRRARRRAATTNAFGTSPASSSGTPITAASATAGWVSRSASSSAGATWIALVLDQLLDPVDDPVASRPRRRRDVAGVQPAVGVDRRARSPPGCSGSPSSPAGRGSTARRARRSGTSSPVAGSTMPALGVRDADGRSSRASAACVAGGMTCVTGLVSVRP